MHLPVSFNCGRYESGKKTQEEEEEKEATPSCQKKVDKEISMDAAMVTV